jgi:hypothetical protein
MEVDIRTALTCKGRLSGHIFIEGDSKLLSGFPWPIIFEPGKKIKLLMDYEIVTQKVLLPIESMLQNAKELQRAPFHDT